MRKEAAKENHPLRTGAETTYPPPRTSKRKDSDVNLILRCDLAKLGCGSPVSELYFHATRKWRFDWALPLVKVGIEIDGGAWTHGRHTQGRGFIADMEKRNYAQAEGWRVYHFTPEQIRNGEAMAFLRKVVP